MWLDKSLVLLLDLTSGVTATFEIYTDGNYDKVDHIEMWAGEWLSVDQAISMD